MKRNPIYVVAAILMILIFVFSACAAKEVTGEIVRFVSEFDGEQAELLGVDVLLEDGSEVFFDIDNVGYEAVKSKLAWEYVYANEHSAVVSDIVCTDDSSITFTTGDGSEIVFEVGSVLNLYVDEEGEYQLDY